MYVSNVPRTNVNIALHWKQNVTPLYTINPNRFVKRVVSLKLKMSFRDRPEGFSAESNYGTVIGAYCRMQKRMFVCIKRKSKRLSCSTPFSQTKTNLATKRRLCCHYLENYLRRQLINTSSTLFLFSALFRFFQCPEKAQWLIYLAVTIET